MAKYANQIDYRLPRNAVLQRDSSKRKRITQCRTRLLFVGLVFCMSYILLVVRLFDVAFTGAEEQNFVERPTVTTSSKLPVMRADILDRNGELLAGSIHTRSLFANPKLVQRFGVEKTVQALQNILPDLDADRLRSKLNSNRSFVYIKRHLTPSQQEQTNSLGIPGLEFEEAQKRLYPLGSLFAHILGYVDIDNNGIAGVEKYFDNLLRKGEEPLVLSVDARIQHILHEEMCNGMVTYNAIGAVGIVMDIRNGEIIAMASLPDFDPNYPGRYAPETRFNRATYGLYEMGSIFKTFTTAMALHYGTAKLKTGYDARNPIKVGRYTIRDAHPQKRWLTVPEIFVHSSNIGTVKMVMEVGKERQKDFLRKLGLFEKLQLELPETATPITPKKWRDINMMTISYGHGISVTPLHLVRAVASLLGEGKLLQPTLIKGGNILTENNQQLIAKDIVYDLRKLMRAVVRHGTGRKADAAGYRVGGKTGTAEKVKSGNYAASDKLASFVGIFPSEDPKYAILVMLDEPKGNKQTYGYATGGWVAAPVVANIVSRMAPLYGIQPVYELHDVDDELEFHEVNYQQNIQRQIVKNYVHTATF